MIKHDETGYKSYWELGKKAKLAGYHQSVCPYRSGHSSRLAWLDGYRSVIGKRTVTKSKFNLGKVVEPITPPPTTDTVVKSSDKEAKRHMKLVTKRRVPVRKPGGCWYRVM